MSVADKTQDQTFPVSAELPGRLTVKNYHGSADHIVLFDFRAAGVQLTHTPQRHLQMTGVWWNQATGSRGLWYGPKKSDEVGSCAHWIVGIQRQITRELEESGRARVYGINFDSDSDVIKDEAKPTLDKLAAMLKSKSDWK